MLKEKALQTISRLEVHLQRLCDFRVYHRKAPATLDIAKPEVIEERAQQENSTKSLKDSKDFEQSPRSRWLKQTLKQCLMIVEVCTQTKETLDKEAGKLNFAGLWTILLSRGGHLTNLYQVESKNAQAIYQEIAPKSRMTTVDERLIEAELEKSLAVIWTADMELTWEKFYSETKLIAQLFQKLLLAQCEISALVFCGMAATISAQTDYEQLPVATAQDNLIKTYCQPLGAGSEPMAKKIVNTVVRASRDILARKREQLSWLQSSWRTLPQFAELGERSPLSAVNYIQNTSITIFGSGGQISISPSSIKLNFGSLLLTKGGRLQVAKTLKVINSTDQSFHIDISLVEGKDSKVFQLFPMTALAVQPRETSNIDCTLISEDVGSLSAFFELSIATIKVKVDLSGEIESVADSYTFTPEKIDFGIVNAHPGSRNEPKSVAVSNKSNAPLLVKGKVYSTSSIGDFRIEPLKAIIPPKETFRFFVRAVSMSQEGKLEETLRIGVGSPLNLIEIPLLVRFRSPKYQLVHPSGPIQRVVIPEEEIDIKSVQSVHEVILHLENIGEVPFRFKCEGDSCLSISQTGEIAPKVKHPIRAVVNRPGFRTEFTAKLRVSVDGLDDQKYDYPLRWGTRDVHFYPCIFKLDLKDNDSIRNYIDPGSGRLTMATTSFEVRNVGTISADVSFEQTSRLEINHNQRLRLGPSARATVMAKLLLSSFEDSGRTNARISGRKVGLTYSVEKSLFAQLDVSPTGLLDFGDVEFKTDRQFGWKISNKGNKPLQINIYYDTPSKESPIEDLLVIIDGKHIFGDRRGKDSLLIGPNQHQECMTQIGVKQLPGPFRHSISIEALNDKIVTPDGRLINKLFELTVLGNVVATTQQKGPSTAAPASAPSVAAPLVWKQISGAEYFTDISVISEAKILKLIESPLSPVLEQLTCAVELARSCTGKKPSQLAESPMLNSLSENSKELFISACWEIAGVSPGAPESFPDPKFAIIQMAERFESQPHALPSLLDPLVNQSKGKALYDCLSVVLGPKTSTLKSCVPGLQALLPSFESAFQLQESVKQLEGKDMKSDDPLQAGLRNFVLAMGVGDSDMRFPLVYALSQVYRDSEFSVSSVIKHIFGFDQKELDRILPLFHPIHLAANTISNVWLEFVLALCPEESVNLRRLADVDAWKVHTGVLALGYGYAKDKNHYSTIVAGLNALLHGISTLEMVSVVSKLPFMLSNDSKEIMEVFSRVATQDVGFNDFLEVLRQLFKSMQPVAKWTAAYEATGLFQKIINGSQASVEELVTTNKLNEAERATVVQTATELKRKDRPLSLEKRLDLVKESILTLSLGSLECKQVFQYLEQLLELKTQQDVWKTFSLGMKIASLLDSRLTKFHKSFKILKDKKEIRPKYFSKLADLLQIPEIMYIYQAAEGLTSKESSRVLQAGVALFRVLKRPQSDALKHFAEDAFLKEFTTAEPSIAKMEAILNLTKGSLSTKLQGWTKECVTLYQTIELHRGRRTITTCIQIVNQVAGLLSQVMSDDSAKITSSALLLKGLCCYAASPQNKTVLLHTLLLLAREAVFRSSAATSRLLEVPDLESKEEILIAEPEVAQMKLKPAKKAKRLSQKKKEKDKARDGKCSPEQEKQLEELKVEIGKVYNKVEEVAQTLMGKDKKSVTLAPDAEISKTAVLITAFLSLKDHGQVWVSAFNRFVEFAKASILPEKVEHAYLWCGICLLHLVEALTLRFRRLGPRIEGMVASQCKEIADTFALIPVDSLPEDMKKERLKLKIGRGSALGEPLDFELPSAQLLELDKDYDPLEYSADHDFLASVGSDTETKSQSKESEKEFSTVPLASTLPTSTDNTQPPPSLQIGGPIEIKIEGFGKPSESPPSAETPPKPTASNPGEKLDERYEVNVDPFGGTPENPEPTTKQFEGKQDISLSSEDIKKQLGTIDLKAVMAGSSLKAQEEMTVGDSSREKKRPLNEKWTYQLLAESIAMDRWIRVSVKSFRDQFTMLQSSRTIHRFQFLCIVDNSGSMSIVESEIQESLVLLMEVLRLLECEFAVGRFGHSCRLLKDFKTPLNFALGQQILESLTFDEGTYPATGLRALANKVWPRIEAKEGYTDHRVAIMITDGLTQETRIQDYKQVTTGKGVRLHIIQLNNGLGQGVAINRISELLRSEVKSEGDIMFLEVSDPETLPKDVAQIVSEEFNVPSPAGGESKVSRKKYELAIPQDPKKSRSLYPVNLKSSKVMRLNVTAQSTALDVKDMVRVRLEREQVIDIEQMEVKHQRKTIDDKKTLREERISVESFYVSVQQVGGKWFIQIRLPSDTSTDDTQVNFKESKIVYVSKPDPPLPHASLLERTSDPDLEARAQLTRVVGEITDRYKIFENQVARITEAAGVWRRLEEKIAEEGEELGTVFEDIVFPYNKYTRRKADLRGATLYLPGLIKAVISDWKYKKIFSTKTAGGRREYSVVIALDVSFSMNGHLSENLLESFACLVLALKKTGIENFSILLFGEKVNVIKTESQEWNAVSVLAFLSELRFNQYATFDADAINCGLDLLATSSIRGPKKMFVLTDGYSTSGLQLSQALQRANEEGVEVVGISVGYDRFFVQKSYQHWIIAALPAALSEAFKALYEGDAESPQPQNWELEKSGEMKDLKAIERKKVFGDLLNDLKAERQMKIQPGNTPGTIVVDICFVLDVTGSMIPYVNVAQNEVGKIITSIEPEIKKQYPSIKLKFRFAVVAFRDKGDRTPFEEYPFDEDQKKVIGFIAQLSPGGGGDIPEDVLGAIDKATKLQWKGTAKFMILMTDAPGHGADLNDDPTDSYPQGVGILAKDVVRELIKARIKLIFCRIDKKATEKMENCLTLNYQPSSLPEDLKDHNLHLHPIDLVDDKTPVVYKYHVVFVLDESGSMQGPPWTQLMGAYNGFLNKRSADQSRAGDIFSVVPFGSGARVAVDRKDLNTTKQTPIDYRSGGTCFSPALSTALAQIRQAGTGYKPVVVFMSDGGAGDGDPEMTQLAAAAQGLVLHVIAFGGGADGTKLQRLATLGGGRYHTAPTGVELTSLFAAIAAECGAMKGLVAAFGAIISKLVVNKILLDFL